MILLEFNFFTNSVVKNWKNGTILEFLQEGSESTKIPARSAPLSGHHKGSGNIAKISHRPIP